SFCSDSSESVASSLLLEEWDTASVSLAFSWYPSVSVVWSTPCPHATSKIERIIDSRLFLSMYFSSKICLFLCVMYQKNHVKNSWYRVCRSSLIVFRNVQNCIFSYVQLMILIFSPRENCILNV